MVEVQLVNGLRGQQRRPQVVDDIHLDGLNRIFNRRIDNPTKPFGIKLHFHLIIFRLNDPIRVAATLNNAACQFILLN